MTDAEASDPHAALVGQVVAGKYRVRRLLGAGGMGAVYEAEQEPLGRRVALKVIKRGLSDDPLAAKRFINEARAVAQLSDPSIVTLHDFGAVDGGDPAKAGGGLYIAMEYLEGRDLRSVIQREGPLPWRRAASIVGKIARALAVAHTRGIVHRDLKPDNVMVLGTGGSESIKVVDFGVAKLLPEHGGSAGMTGTGLVVGTPGYISPEQISGVNDDPRSDLYALGVIAYEMLLARSPFDGETPVKIVLKHVTEPPPRLRGAVLGVEVPEAVETLVLRLLAKDPSDRPANAILLANEVERLLHDEVGLGPHQPTEAALPAVPLPAVPAVGGMPTAETPLPAQLPAPPVSVEPTSPPPVARDSGRSGMWWAVGGLLIALVAVLKDDVSEWLTLVRLADEASQEPGAYEPEPSAPPVAEEPRTPRRPASPEKPPPPTRASGGHTKERLKLSLPPRMDRNVLHLFEAAARDDERAARAAARKLVRDHAFDGTIELCEAFYDHNEARFGDDEDAIDQLDEASLVVQQAVLKETATHYIPDIGNLPGFDQGSKPRGSR